MSLKLIGSSESTIIEWKPSLSQIHEIVESITAFANTEGGRLLVGVSKTGEVQGVQIGKGTVEDLVNRIAQHTDPRIQPKITVKKIKGKQIIVIEVKQSKDKLVLADGRPYKRVGPSTRQMGKDEYEGLILEKYKESHHFDNEICKGSSLTDIDITKVKNFVLSAKKKRDLDVDENGSLKAILTQLKLLNNGKLTNGAVLLFGKNPEKFFEQLEVKCIRFKGVDVAGEMIDLKPVNADVIRLVKEAEKFIFDHIPMRAWIESGKLERQEKWLYPPKAIREILSNALAHRDYRTTSKVQIRIFDDRMEFWNPGHLPQGWTTATLKQTHESKPVNPSIATAFFRIGYAEEVGTGTNKIISWCKEWGLPEPEFEYAGSSIVVTLRKTKITEGYLTQFSLTERESKVIEHIVANKQIGSGEIQKMFKITRETANQLLKRLIGLKIIKKQGVGKTTHYILKNS